MYAGAVCTEGSRDGTSRAGGSVWKQPAHTSTCDACSSIVPVSSGDQALGKLKGKGCIRALISVWLVLCSMLWWLLCHIQWRQAIIWFYIFIVHPFSATNMTTVINNFHLKSFLLNIQNLNCSSPQINLFWLWNVAAMYHGSFWFPFPVPLWTGSSYHEMPGGKTDFGRAALTALRALSAPARSAASSPVLAFWLPVLDAGSGMMQLEAGIRLLGSKYVGTPLFLSASPEPLFPLIM